MLQEGRRRDAAANALLGLAFAASAAQSPKDLVRSGHIEGPSIQLMSNMMRKRKEANRNLDSGRVSHPARNRKMKTFKEFVEETYISEGQSREEAEKKRLAKDNPDEWRVRKVGRAGEESWTTKRKDSLSQQGKRRRSRLNPLTQKELESHANRNLRPNAKELAAIAYDREEDAMEKQENAARRQSRKKKVKHVQDHSQPLQQDKRRPENKERFERVTPGHVASNLQVTSEPKNLAKGSKPPKKGERGYGTTRSGAVKNRLDKAQKFSDKMDRLIASIRKNK